MKWVCSDTHPDSEPILRCSNADSYYVVERMHYTFTSKGHSRWLYGGVSKECPESFFYQACGLAPTNRKEEILSGNKGSKYPCGVLCIRQMFNDFMLKMDLQSLCMPKSMHSCSNLDPKELKSICEEHRIMNSKLICDGVCNNVLDENSVFTDCFDEKSCNGYDYGIFCPEKYSSSQGLYVAGKYMVCVDGQAVTNPCIWSTLDDEICAKAVNPAPGSDITYCKIDPNVVLRLNSIGFAMELETFIPLFNFSRCGPIHSMTPFTILNFGLCDGYREQTNCTDQTKIGLFCKVDTFLSSVAEQVICNSKLTDRTQAICDDSLDIKCYRLSKFCYLHKHRICDGRIDCDSGIDEANAICTVLIDFKCVLRFGNKTIHQISVEWIHDGMADCEGGEDEKNDMPSCGAGDTLRYINSNATKSCSEVYLNLCDIESERKYAEFSELCDRTESCGNELRVCRKSRRQHPLITSPTRHNGVNLLYFCLHGLEEIQIMLNVSCDHSKFVFPKYSILGRNKYPMLYHPGTKLDCKYFYGSIYVFLNCLDLCETSTCPLKNVLKYDDCPGQFPDRVYTLADSSYLTFLMKQPIHTDAFLYHNEIFPCDNGFCVGYDKVCNLVDDCGDGTDEMNCKNIFWCENTGESLTHDRVCDGKIDCLDLSDECNLQCRKRIVNSLGLRIVAGVIGLLSFLFNFLTIPKKVYTLKDCKSGDSLSNSILLLVISFGDLLVGLYIMIVWSYDLYYGDSYCLVQLRWLTGSICSVIGVLSTAGFLMSTFSMTALSIQQAYRIKKCLCRYRKPTTADKWDVAIIIFIVTFVVTIAFLFALIPLFDGLEDWFVNGIYYGEENSLFIGAPGKKKHMEILKEYYGRLSSSTLDWNLIIELVFGMFSRDHSGIESTKLKFYGNDAVCLFKYFVTIDDPQCAFVWLTIGIHSLNVVAISVSYISVWRTTVSSSADLTKSNNDETNPQKAMIKKRHHKLQRKISLIIGSNLICWAPFLFVSIIHAVELVDANPSYSIFSLVLLPINSVINPIIWNDGIQKKFQQFKSVLFTTASKIKFRSWMNWQFHNKTDSQEAQKIRPPLRAANPEAQAMELKDIFHPKQTHDHRAQVIHPDNKIISRTL